MNAQRPRIFFFYADGNDVDIHRPPGSIAYHVSRFLEQKAELIYGDWLDSGYYVDGIRDEDVVIGHPHGDPSTPLSRACRKRAKKNFILWPFQNGCPEFNKPVFPIAERCEKMFLISGPHWISRIADNGCGIWRKKVIRLDNPVDPRRFPHIKTNFNQKGSRGIFISSRTGPEKNVHDAIFLANSCRMRTLVAGSYTGTDDKIMASCPNVTRLGWIDPSSRATAQIICDNCDFILMTPIGDASPTTLFEAMSWGLIPVATKECGYSLPGMEMIDLENKPKAVKVLERLNASDEESLKRASDMNFQYVSTVHTWDRFCNGIWDGIKHHFQ